MSHCGYHGYWRVPELSGLFYYPGTHSFVKGFKLSNAENFLLSPDELRKYSDINCGEYLGVTGKTLQPTQTLFQVEPQNSPSSNPHDLVMSRHLVYI